MLVSQRTDLLNAFALRKRLSAEDTQKESTRGKYVHSGAAILSPTREKTPLAWHLYTTDYNSLRNVTGISVPVHLSLRRRVYDEIGSTPIHVFTGPKVDASATDSSGSTQLRRYWRRAIKAPCRYCRPERPH